MGHGVHMLSGLTLLLEDSGGMGPIIAGSSSCAGGSLSSLRLLSGLARSPERLEVQRRLAHI